MRCSGRRALFAVLAMSLLGACANPVPPDKSDYVGKWKGLAMALLITQDGADWKMTVDGVELTRVQGSADALTI